MNRSLDIQCVGAVLVIAAFIGAEAAAWYLFVCPSCSLAWYLNLGPFHVFETARGSTSAMRHLFAPPSLPIAVAALVIVLLARRFRLRLLVALAANLSFAFAIALVAAELRAQSSFSLSPFLAMLQRQNSVLGLAIILIVSFVSCITSHASFIIAILSETRILSGEPHRRANII